ncbi:hypothetical protein GYMLUDRAFT_84279 [Collybiopsis luxurians FD-317 M1]|uniref:F-box domain-containing protein n=1 Tax=Collybiopsis luxurians FD-317 M1 TaxID=944289 RepID=A0A0D0CJA2_9AGAR|nr:hypothetical protein GYMLUDRAFT_84279 [Collybiopsis luxurians FD-317 M1]
MNSQQHVFDEGYNDNENDEQQFAATAASSNSPSSSSSVGVGLSRNLAKTISDHYDDDGDVDMSLNVNLDVNRLSGQECEELAYQLLASLPRSRLATIQRRLAPLLQFDVVGSLPAEVSLQIFSYLPFPALLTCALVCRRWSILANDQTLWKKLCDARGWRWKQPLFNADGDEFGLQKGKGKGRATAGAGDGWGNPDDDEGMGDSDEDAEGDQEEGEEEPREMTELEAAKMQLTMMHRELDDGFASMSMSFSGMSNSMAASGSASGSGSSSTLMNRTSVYPFHSHSYHNPPSRRHPQTVARRSAPSLLSNPLSGPSSSSNTVSSPPKPDYKLLHQTHVKIQRRILTSSYRLSALQTRGGGPPSYAHTNTIYCLQLYTYPSTSTSTSTHPSSSLSSFPPSSRGTQVLFTGSRDKTIREWNLSTGQVQRVISGLHHSSVLSICVHDGLLASGGSDRRVVVWDLVRERVVKVLEDHEDSVLCVRFDGKRLVSCSKDRTVRTYLFPDLEPQFILGAHRAAVNAVSISDTLIVSGSGDRSIRLWDAQTGKLLRTFENHHSRGIASIDFKPPFVLSGSSDKHLRLFDITTLQGWSTSGEYEHGVGHGVVPPTPPLFNHGHGQSQTNAGGSAVGGGGAGYDSGFPGFAGGGYAPGGPAGLGVGGGWSGGPGYGLGGYGYHPSVAFGQQGQAVLCQTCGNSGLVALGVPGALGGGSGGVGGVGGGGDVGGGAGGAGGVGGRRTINVHNLLHRDLVRSVAFGPWEDFVLSGSYDLSIKVWDRKTGALVADLSGGHTGRIFCIGFDGTKIVSCGEDQRVCIWDFAHGIDTSFIQL